MDRSDRSVPIQRLFRHFLGRVEMGESAVPIHEPFLLFDPDDIKRTQEALISFAVDKKEVAWRMYDARCRRRLRSGRLNNSHLCDDGRHVCSRCP